MSKAKNTPAEKPKATQANPAASADKDAENQGSPEKYDGSNETNGSANPGAPDPAGDEGDAKGVDAADNGNEPKASQANPAASADKDAAVAKVAKKAGHVRVHCALPNASESINGVAFLAGKDGMVSETVTREVAERFAAIPGYTILEK